MTSIIQFADIHFGAEDIEAMAAVADAIIALKPDVILVCGDITQNGKKSEFFAARDWLRTLPYPKIVTPGNHDTPMFGVLHRFFSPFGRYNKIIAPLGEPHYTDQYVTIMPLNTSRGWQFKTDWSLGVVDLEKLEHISRLMSETSPGTVKFIASHHPFVYPKSSPLQRTTKNGPTALFRLSELNIDGVLTGHVHVPFMLERQPDATEIMSIGAGTLSVRRRDKPASFNHITVDDKTLSVTAVQWEDGVYAPSDTYTKPVSELKSRRQADPV